jgi:hypothetical protein
METLQDIVNRIGVGDIIALILILVSAFLWVTQGEIPESLLSVTLIVVGFFFGESTAKRGMEAGAKAANPKPQAPLIGEER